MNSNLATIGLLALVAATSLVLFHLQPSSTGAIVCSPDHTMYIEDGRQLSVHCINTPIGGTNGMFFRKQDLDNRRYQIAQRTWEYQPYENVR